MRIFGCSIVEVLTSRRSDHQPIMLITREKHGEGSKRKKVFRFEGKWVFNKDGEQIVS